MRALSAVLVLVAALACERAETPPAPQASPPRPQVSAPAPAAAAGVAAIELGRAVAADGRVSAPAASFSPTDTIYVSVVTEGQPSGATLRARWSYQDGQLVSEGSETLETSARTATEFHIAKPDGWPTGRYRVEIALDGRPAGAREFEVR